MDRQDQDVAGFGPVEQVGGGGGFIGDEVDRVGCEAVGLQGLAHHCGDLAGAAAAFVAGDVLEHDPVRAVPRRHLRQCAEIVIQPVAGMAQDQAKAAITAQRAGHVEQAGQAFGVVCIVQQHLHAADVPAFQPAAVVVVGVAEIGQHCGDDLRRHAECETGQRRAGQIGDVVARHALQRERHVGHVAQMDAGSGDAARMQPQRTVALHAGG